MDPNNHRGLVIFSNGSAAAGGQRVYRTINADAEPPSAVSWQSITQSTPLGNTLPFIRTVAVAPSSGVIFAGGDAGDPTGDIWMTADASTWVGRGAGQLPSTALLTSLVIDTSQPCDQNACTLYVTNLNPTDSSAALPDRVFRSTNAGATWTNISGPSGQCASMKCLPPNLPISRLVIHPSDPSVVYVATDLGMYQGCRSADLSTCSAGGNSWIWGTFVEGFPKTMFTTDLVLAPKAGLLRAFTYGRSVWERSVPAYVVPDPEVKVNDVNPATEVEHDSVRVSSNPLGTQHAAQQVRVRVAR